MLYFCLLLMAGITKNSTPNDENYLKRTLNLGQNNQKIRENLTFLTKTFPKLFSKDGMVKFKNFRKLHHYIGKSEGTPQELQRMRKIEREYIERKKYNILLPDGSENKDKINILYKQHCRAIKQLLIFADGKEDDVLEAIGWLGDSFDKKGLDWNINTIVKWYPEWEKTGKKSPELKRLEATLGH